MKGIGVPRTRHAMMMGLLQGHTYGDIVMKLFGNTASPAFGSFNDGSNIMGATGLPRAALRRMFAQSGLFGPESTLTITEQAGVYAELQLPAGVVPAVALTHGIPNYWRVSAIRAVARMVLRREPGGFEQQAHFARGFGIDDRVTAEVVRTVRTSMLLYGAGVPVRRDVAVCSVASDRQEANNAAPAALASA